MWPQVKCQKHFLLCHIDVQAMGIHWNPLNVCFYDIIGTSMRVSSLEFNMNTDEGVSPKHLTVLIKPSELHLLF